MPESTNTPKIHRACKLGKIKECDVSFDTNIKTKLFCCDDHRYRWHNNLKTLFRRMVRIEKKNEDIEERVKVLELSEYNRESYALEQRERGYE